MLVHLVDCEVHRERVADALVWSSLLNDAEVARAGEFRFRADSDRFTAARGLARRLVGEHLQRDAKTLAFCEGPHGKPAIVDADDWRFNVSHSGDWVLVAIARGREVGVDVELVQPDLEIMDIAPSVFTSSELNALGCLPVEHRRAAFYRLWARKEAVLKAWGTGFSLEATRVDIGFAEPGAPLVVRVPGFPPVKVADVAVDERHAGAVAVVADVRE
ncbi:MAG: 4'-phosphopantetheinyl transferase superfamily protein [Polyangiaceae bacterium]|nr:4'-phosphopantetheinyl transferase superfamily protein [Polyangiaceae bacterium]